MMSYFQLILGLQSKGIAYKYAMVQPPKAGHFSSMCSSTIREKMSEGWKDFFFFSFMFKGEKPLMWFPVFGLPNSFFPLSPFGLLLLPPPFFPGCRFESGNDEIYLSFILFLFTEMFKLKYDLLLGSNSVSLLLGKMIMILRPNYLIDFPNISRI